MVTLDDIRAAQALLHGIAVRTPLFEWTAPSDPRKLFLKLENQQPIGAFKLRGAYNKVASLTDEERRRGVISYSSGNHAQGVAYAARALGVKAIIVMPSNAPKNKLEATAALGAEIVIVGPGSYNVPISLNDSDSTGSTSLSNLSLGAPGSSVTVNYNGGVLGSAT